MRILLITHFFPPTHTAGTEQYTLGIAKGLIRAGHQAQVLCTGRWSEGASCYNGFSDDIHEGVPVRRLHLNWMKGPDPNRYLYDNPVTAELARDFTRELAPDVVHITSCHSLSGSIIPSLKSHNLPVVLTLTDFWFVCPRHTLLRWNQEICDGQADADECLGCMLAGTKVFRITSLLPSRLQQRVLGWLSQRPALNRMRGLRGLAIDMVDRRSFLANVLGQADQIIAPSETLKEMCLRSGTQVDITVAPYGHDVAWLDSLPGCSHSRLQPNDRVRIGYIGQITHLKGVHLLLDAWETLKANDASLVIWGDTTRSPEYGQQIRERVAKLKNVTLCGPFEHSQLGNVLANIDVTVVPSLWYENNPLVIQESFAAGVPVIAADLGGMAEFVKHGVNGLLFRHSDAQDLAHVLNQVTEDPSIIARLRACAPRVKSVEEEVSELVALYQSLVSPTSK